MSAWIIYDKNGLAKCEARQLQYSGEFMGACSINVNISSPIPIKFELGDWLEYRGERFELNYDPSVVKESSSNTYGEGFQYENIVFNSLADELTRCDFLDYVPKDNELHYSSLPTFSFFADSITKLADRIQANLDRVYTDDKKWTVEVHPEYVNTLNVNITASNNTVWDALGFVNSKFGANFIIRGRKITIGTTGLAVGQLFSYGKGNGLYKIERNAESSQKIITRLRAYGSTRNMPTDYYKNVSGGNIPNNMAVKNLMLPSFPVQTHDPYIDSKNIVELGIREGTVFFDGSGDLEEIYPTMEGMTAEGLKELGIAVNATGRLDEVLSAEQISDNGKFEPAEGEEQVTIPDFTITLKDVGFNLNDYLGTSAATISMKDGMCGGRDFEIVSCEKEGDSYILACHRHYDESLDLYFPYNGYQIKGGDKFVLLNIEMPDVYIKAASQRLFNAATAYLEKNDYARYSYTLSVDNIFMARQHKEATTNEGTSIHDVIKEGDLMLFEDEDLGIDGGITISSLSIKEYADELLIPEYEITLQEEKTVGTIEKIQNQITNLVVNGGGGDTVINTEQIKSIVQAVGSKLFLSKTKDDRTPYKLNVGDKLTAEKGIQIGKSFASGLTGSGGFIDEQANAELESLIIRRFLEVPELRFNRVQVTLGDKWNAPGAGVIERVVPDSATTGTVFLKLEEGEYGAIAEGDICMGIFHSEDSSMNATDDEEIYGKTDDGNTCLSGFQFAGFYTCYFTITSITGKNNGQFAYELRMDSRWDRLYHPSESMHFVCYGSFTNKDRQTSAYTTRTYTRLLHKQNSWEITIDNIAMQYGDLSNMNYHGLDMEGYSIFTNNIYNRGVIKQIKDNGEEILTAIDKGNWVSGTKYDYYDRVSHNGSLWLCVNSDGTNTEPMKGNSDWLLQVSSGDSFDVSGRFSSSKAPYSPNSTIDFANKVWASTETVDYAPYGIWTDASGNRFQFNDGGFCLVDDTEVRSGWTVFVDLSGFKDGEDGKSLIVQYSKDGSNWHDIFQSGDVYMRQKLGEDGAWSDKMRIVGEAGAAGENGEYTDFEFAVNSSMDEPPTSGWQDAPPSVGVGRYLWMRKRVVHGDGTAENWSIPVRLTGDKGDSTFKSTVFIRTNSKPSVPTGGSYESPIPTSSPKWSDGIPSGEEILWASTRTFALGEVEGEPWSEPSQMTDTADFDVDWSSVETNVGNPTTHPQNWSNVATESTIWMATRTKKNGVWSDWQVSKVKGEKGDSVEFVGRFKTGMIIPSLGVVAMGGSNWVAKKSTSNPPLWTWTDNSGNRFIFSDGGYALTGDENEEEYELMVANGKDGKDGTDYEYIFINTTTDTQPATPPTVQRDDYIPNGWHDDPLGVTEGIPYEWVSQRKKKDGLWGAYSTPSVWAKFGEDGTNWEFVYQRTKTESSPSTPSTKQEDDYIPSGWTDDPKGVSDEYPFEWMSKRRKKGSAWGEYTKPALWASFSILSYKSTVFIRTNDTPSTPTGGSFDSPIPTSTPKWYDGIPSGEQTLWASTRIFTKNGSGIQQGEWSTPRSLTDTASFEAIYHDSEKEPTPPTNYPSTSGSWTPDNGWTDDPTDKSVWMATATKSNGVWGAWQVSKIKGEKGVDGKDGKDYEYIYRRTTYGSPSRPNSLQEDDYVPEDWTDDPMGVTDYYLYEWTCKRTKKDGVWSEFSDPALWAKFGLNGANGQDGKDGQDGDPGIQGCIIRDSEWAEGVEYRNDEGLTEGTRYIDVVLVRDENAATGWVAYKCIQTHTSTYSTKPYHSLYWEEFGTNTTAIFTSLIVAKNAKITFLQGNQLLVQKDDGTITAGLSGSEEGEKVRFWAGAKTPDDAPFRVTEDGDAHVSGTITAGMMKYKTKTGGGALDGYTFAKGPGTYTMPSPTAFMKLYAFYGWGLSATLSMTLQGNGATFVRKDSNYAQGVRFDNEFTATSRILYELICIPDGDSFYWIVTEKEML